MRIMNPPPRALDRDAPFVMVQDRIAEKIGESDAYLLQSIHGFLYLNRNTPRCRRDGRVWMYKSLQGYHDEYFTAWSLDKLNRVMSRLIKKGYVIKGNYNRKGYDRTNWYTIDYDKLYPDIGLEKDWEWDYLPDYKDKIIDKATAKSATTQSTGADDSDCTDNPGCTDTQDNTDNPVVYEYDPYSKGYWRDNDDEDPEGLF